MNSKFQKEASVFHIITSYSTWI